MNVWIYALEEQEVGWVYWFTVSPSVDVSIWEKKHVEKLFPGKWLCSVRSIAQAERLLARLNVTKHRGSLITSKKIDEYAVKETMVDKENMAVRDNFAANIHRIHNEEDRSGLFSIYSEGAWSDLLRQAHELEAKLRGRALLEEEIVRMYPVQGIRPLLQWLMVEGKIHLNSAIGMKTSGWFRTVKHFCRRCGTAEGISQSDCARCGEQCYTCQTCITLGRSRSCELWVTSTAFADSRNRIIEPRNPQSVYSETESNRTFGAVHTGDSGVTGVKSDNGVQGAKGTKGTKGVTGFTGATGGTSVRNLEKWRLSQPQMEAVMEMLDFLRSANGERFLVWAVCGAGKTEVIFPAIEQCLSRGGNVLLATPRKDVVLELEPRLEKAFSTTDILVLHGSSKEKWGMGSIVLATTHQVIRFSRAFDLVIVDEVDAFPFDRNPMLYYGVERAVRPKGNIVYLTATPTDVMQREVKRGKLPCTHIPIRYHGYPLPVPEIVTGRRTKRLLDDLQHPSVRSFVEKVLSRGAQLFWFVPRIGLAEDFAALLPTVFPEVVPEAVAATHSKDSLREIKVNNFRNRQIRIVVTTTILERGVTVPNSDVLVWDADDPVFGAAALVQMAGRAGRSADDPDGKVLFFARQKSIGMVEAVRQIEMMNRLANKKGWL